MDGINAPGVGGTYSTSSSQDAAIEKAEASLDAALAETPEPVQDAAATPEPAPVVESPSTPEPVVAPAGTTPPASAPQYSDAAQALLAKYGGDINKAAEHYWEAVRQNAELTRPPVAPTPAPQPETDPEVQQLDSRLLVLDQEFRGFDTDFVKAKTRREELEASLEELQDKLAAPDIDADVPQLQVQFRRARTDLGRARQREQEIVLRARENRGQFDVTTALRSQALKFQRIFQTRQAEEAERYNFQVSTFRNDFDNALESASGTVPEELKSEFGDYARAMALRYLQTPGPDGQRPVISDPKAYTSALAQRYLGAFDKHHRVRSSQYGADKAAHAQLSTPGAVKAAPPDKAKRKSVQEWDEFHEDLVF